ncbi:MAG: helix-turn-helix transcriptional regulator [Chthoniobacteraceae bacterium]
MNKDQRQIYKHLGSRIKALRADKFSQDQLAQAVDLTRTSIVNIEAGRQKLLVHNLFMIADALGVQPSDILCFNEPLGQNLPDFQAIEFPGKGEEVNLWIQRGVTKAMQSQLS